MTSSLLLSVTTFLYLLVALGYLLALVFKRPGLSRAANLLVWLTTALQTVAIALRWIESYQMGIGHAPLTNMYESLVFFAWAILLAYLVVQRRYRSPALGLAVAPFAFLAMAYASFGTESQIQPLIPALQSNWLIAHVVTCFLGYAALAVSCGAAIFLLAKGGQADSADELVYRSLLIGFLLLSAGIGTGAVWADKAWGAYWSWDPKETWSLITWLVYAVIIHGRVKRGWQGRGLAWGSVLGFICVLFTYLGVNFLLPGLHSYG